MVQDCITIKRSLEYAKFHKKDTIQRCFLLDKAHMLVV